MFCSLTLKYSAPEKKNLLFRGRKKMYIYIYTFCSFKPLTIIIVIIIQHRTLVACMKNSCKTSFLVWYTYLQSCMAVATAVAAFFAIVSKHLATHINNRENIRYFCIFVHSRCWKLWKRWKNSFTFIVLRLQFFFVFLVSFCQLFPPSFYFQHFSIFSAQTCRNSSYRICILCMNTKVTSLYERKVSFTEIEKIKEMEWWKNHGMCLHLRYFFVRKNHIVVYAFKGAFP